MNRGTQLFIAIGIFLLGLGAAYGLAQADVPNSGLAALVGTIISGIIFFRNLGPDKSKNRSPYGHFSRKGNS